MTSTAKRRNVDEKVSNKKVTQMGEMSNFLFPAFNARYGSLKLEEATYIINIDWYR